MAHSADDSDDGSTIQTPDHECEFQTFVTTFILAAGEIGYGDQEVDDSDMVSPIRVFRKGKELSLYQLPSMTSHDFEEMSEYPKEVGRLSAEIADKLQLRQICTCESEENFCFVLKSDWMNKKKED